MKTPHSLSLKPTLVRALLVCALAIPASFAAAPVAAEPAPVTGPNLLTNGGFETGDKSGWKNAAGIVELHPTPEGRYVLRINAIAGHANLSQRVPFTHESTVEISAWVRTNLTSVTGTKGAQLTLRCVGENNVYLGGASDATKTAASDEFVELKLRYQTKPGTVELQVYLQVNPGNEGAAFFDDVKLAVVTP